MALLELSNISYVVNEKSIIRDVSLSVHEGEYLTVVGPSGCLLYTSCHRVGYDFW